MCVKNWHRFTFIYQNMKQNIFMYVYLMYVPFILLLSPPQFTG